jgi:hypothetical protein
MQKMWMYSRNRSVWTFDSELKEGTRTRYVGALQASRHDGTETSGDAQEDGCTVMVTA